MSDIVLSSAVRNNLLALQNTADLLGQTQERLATGKKVNSALDDPTAFFTAASLENRANDLNRLLDSVGLAIQTLDAADNAITALTDLVESAQATARQALESTPGTISAVAATEAGTGVDLGTDVAATALGTDIGADSAELDVTGLGLTDGETFSIDVGGTSVTFEFDTANDGVSGGNTALGASDQTLGAAITAINGALGAAATVSNGGSGSNTQISIVAANNDEDITITGDAGVLASLGLDAVGIGPDADNRLVEPSNSTIGALSGTLTFQVGSGTTTTLTFGATNPAISNRTELEAALTLDGGTLTIDSSDNLSVASSDTTSSITIGGTLASTFGFSASVDASTSVDTASTQRTNLQAQFNAVLTQIDQLAADATFNGINLLQGDNLQVTFNEDGTSSLTISGVDFDSDGLGINAVSGDGFQLQSNITATLSELEAGVATLRAQSGTFGSNLSVVETRQEFTKNLINTLETGAGNLTLADTNEEGANLLALQTRQQLSSVALSLASQADQNVLQLF